MADQALQDQSLIDKIREYMMAHGGVGGSDNKTYDVAMGVDQSSGTAKGYAMGGMVQPNYDEPGVQDASVSDFLLPLLMGNAAKGVNVATAGESAAPMAEDAIGTQLREGLMQSMSKPSGGYAYGGEVAMADGGMVPDLGNVPIPNEQPPQPPQAPMQNVMANAQGMGRQLYGQYTPENRNALYASMLERQNSMPNAIGGGLASLGDAIARGYGRDQTNFLDKTLQGQKEGVRGGLEAFDTAQKGTLGMTQAGMEMGKIDPTSAISKIYQDSYSGPLKKLGYSDEQIGKMSASNIEPVAQVGLKYGDIEAQKELKEATLDLTAKMNAAQIENMKAGRSAQQQEIKQKQGEVNKAADVEAAKHWLMHPVLASQAQARLAQGSGAMGAQAPQMPTFATEAEAHKANLPKGSIVMIGGRRARVD